jgi:hypothetical protein
MPTLVIPNGVLVKLNWTIKGRAAVNALGSTPTGAITIDQTLTNTISTAIKSTYTSSGLAAQHTNNTVLSTVSVKDCRTANRTEFIGAGAAVPGTQVGDTLPSQTAFVITLRTQFAGKSFRGRIYLPSGGEASNDINGNALPAFETAALAFINGINTNLQASGLALAVMSRPEPGHTIPAKIINPRAGGTERVTGVFSRGLHWETQRRRAGRLP